MNGWREGRLGDFIELKRGFDLPRAEREEGAFPVISSSGFSGTHVRPRVAAPGVVTGRYGTIGEVHYVKTDYWPLNTTLYVRDFKGNVPRFVSYFLKCFDFGVYSDKAAVPGVNRNHVHSARVFFPPAAEQQAIAELLGALDDKIELNRRIASTCRELAHAIFRSRYRSDDPDLPHEPLGEHVEVVRGLSYTSADLGDQGIPLHNLDSVQPGGGYKRDGIKWYHGDHKQKHAVSPGDVVAASVDLTWNLRVVASPARIPRRFGASLFSQDLFAVRPKDSSPLSKPFLYLLLLPGPLRAEVAGYANGTTVNRIPLDALQKPRFAVPTRALVGEIDALVTPLFDRAEAAEDESETLAQLRDTLLPKLVSGEVRLRDVEPELPLAEPTS